MSICGEDIFLDRKAFYVIIVLYEMKSEVELINKQKFLAELSRLLTFMYEEDRQEALAMYSSMFDDAEDEQKLIQLLMSPTRQAVVVARAYDAKDRKLQVKSQSREGSVEGDGEVPDFAVAIEKVRKEAEEREIMRAGISDDQFSFFDEPEEDEPAEETAEETAAPAEPFMGEAVPDSFDIVSEEEAPDVEVLKEETLKAEELQAEAEAVAEAVEETADELAEQPEREESEIVEEAAEEAVEEVGEAVEQTAEPFDYKRDILEEEEYPEPEREAMVGWLTLFVIFAIPIGFVACVLMIVFAIVFLVLAAAVVAAGVFAISSLFSGFAVFADILLVGGAAVAALALGVLFLWTAIWFLFGAIPGIIRGLIELGRDWCYREVAE